MSQNSDSHNVTPVDSNLSSVERLIELETDLLLIRLEGLQAQIDVLLHALGMPPIEFDVEAGVDGSRRKVVVHPQKPSD